MFEYKLVDGKWTWQPLCWKTIHDVSALVKGVNEVRSGKVEGGKIYDGAAVELE